MLTFLDKTFCGSRNCQNKCGRKMIEYEKELWKKDPECYVAYAYFCDEEGECYGSNENGGGGASTESGI